MRTSPNGAARANVLKNTPSGARVAVRDHCGKLGAVPPARLLVFKGVDEKRQLRQARLHLPHSWSRSARTVAAGCRAPGTPAVNPGCSQEEKLGSTALGRRGRERILKWRSNCGALVVRRCRIMPAAAIAITAQVRGPT